MSFFLITYHPTPNTQHHFLFWTFDYPILFLDMTVFTG